MALTAAAGCCLGAVTLSAGLFSHDINVVAVTDMTAAGKTVTAPTPTDPTYYMIIDYGKKPIDPSFEATAEWSGEKYPDRNRALRWVIEALKEQHYLVATKEHPPTLLLAYAWGLVRGGNKGAEQDNGYIQNPKRPALGFLGGEKLGLMWEQERNGSFVDPRALTRSFRSGVTLTVWDLSAESLYFGRLRAYPIQSVRADVRKVLLWETRFACASDGTTMSDSLPFLLKASAPYFGRETVKPVAINATKTFGGSVTLGDLKVIETDVRTPRRSERK